METNTSEIFHYFFTKYLTMLFVTQYIFIDLSNCFKSIYINKIFLYTVETLHWFVRLLLQ